MAVAALRYAPSMTEPVWEFPVALPRHAFSARDAARAGDLWRAFQEAAVGASSRAGWSARRFSEAGTAFVVRTMTVRHHRETYYGEPLHAPTSASSTSPGHFNFLTTVVRSLAEILSRFHDFAHGRFRSDRATA